MGIEESFKEAKIFVTATGNKNIIMAEHMAQMRNQAIVCNICHFDNEIDVAGLEAYPGIKKINIKAQVDKFVFPDGHSIILLASRPTLVSRRSTSRLKWTSLCSLMDTASSSWLLAVLSTSVAPLVILLSLCPTLSPTKPWPKSPSGRRTTSSVSTCSPRNWTRKLLASTWASSVLI